MCPAIDNGKERNAQLKLLAERLARETGIREEEAKRLIDLIGADWNSLLREASFLKGRLEGCRHLADPPDAALVEAKHPVVAALLLKVGLELIPGAKILAAIIARNRRIRPSVIGNSQPDGEAVWAFQPMIKVFGCHRPVQDPFHKVKIHGLEAGEIADHLRGEVAPFSGICSSSIARRRAFRRMSLSSDDTLSRDIAYPAHKA